MDDFLIIGGGIAGTSAGARLAALGRVTLLETESALGYHASGRSAALFEPNYGLAPTVALSRASADFFEASGVLSPRGLMFIAGAGADEAFERDVAAMGLEEIGAEAARARVPVLDPAKVTRAGWHRAAWDIDTDRLIQGFAREIRAAGRVVTGAKAETIRRIDGGWEVETRGQSFTARVLVNAAGAWADDIARLAGIAPIGLTPKRRSMARVAAPGGHDPRDWPMVIGAGETWYMKPDAGALLISPADADPAEPHDAWADDMVLAAGIAGWEAHVTTPVSRMIANWAGLRTFSPDGNLVIGRAPEDPTFLWCAGQGGYGFQTAPAASQLVADLAGGRTPVIESETVAALDPARYA
ncbi:MAG TPA: glycerol-3-phosphate dehydrogenase [Rhodobacteraceae bacterium]|nr:glycerol-3-phosphate dehydrogenase [Paracoccaceae bacterium]